MKYLFFLVSTVLILCTNALTAQNVPTNDEDKKEIIEFLDQLLHRVIIDGDLASFKDFLPNNGILMNMNNQKIEEYTVEEIIKDWSSQSEIIKDTGYKILPDSYAYKTNDGNTDWAYYTVEHEQVILKTKKKRKSYATYLDIFIKEDGNWVNHTQLMESYKVERNIAVVDKSILDDYNGTYKSERLGNDSKIYISNDGKNLIISFEGKQYTYSPLSEYSFFTKDKPHNLVFNRDKKGKVIGYSYIVNNYFDVNKKIN